MLRILLLATLASLAAATCDKNLLPDHTFLLGGTQVQFPCASTKRIYTQADRYISENVLPTRAQIWRDQAFVAIPRYKPGVPVTLARVQLRTKTCAAQLEPYPCWSQQEEGNCDALQSVVDLYLDAQALLWVLDTGIVNSLEQPVRRCSPRVVAYDLNTGKVVKRIDLSPLVTPHSRLQQLVVDYNAEGAAYVYVSDAASRAILVHDVSVGSGWRVVLPQAVTTGCARRDVMHIALVRKSSGVVLLYISYLCSPRLFSIRTEFLQSGNAGGRIIDVGRKPYKIVIVGTDGGAAIFFRRPGEGEVRMWNSEACFKEENFLKVQGGDGCRLATHVMPGWKRLMWVLESNFHDFLAESVGCAGASVALHPIVKTCD